MPVDGQRGTAADGTPVQWSAALGRAIPLTGAQALKAPPPAPGAFNPASKISSEDADALKNAAADVAQKQTLATRAGEFTKAIGDIHTGPGYADTSLDLPIIGHVGTIPSLERVWDTVTNPAKAAQLQNADNISSQTWAQMRPPKSGPIRPFEAAAWKKAFPNIGEQAPADQATTARLQKEYADAAAQQDFAQHYVHSGQGNYAAALKAWNTQQQNQQPGAPLSPGAALQAKSAAFRQQNDPLGILGN